MSSLQEYANLFERLDLSELSVEEEGLKLTMKRDSMKVPPEKKPVVSSPAVEAEEKSVSDTVSGTEIKAPLLGVFYSNEIPVKEGDIVKKGDVLCSIEAMKMMNEVRSSTDGKVIKILAENGSLVEYHQTLFVIE